MQVFDNDRQGQLFIGSNQAAVEFKRGENPLNIECFIQLEDVIFPTDHSRFKLDWHAGVPASAASGLLPKAFGFGRWDMRSLVSERGASECPDFFDAVAADGTIIEGHLSMIARICQLLCQGKNVMIQGTSAGSPTYIRYGRLFSPLTPPRPNFDFDTSPYVEFGAGVGHIDLSRFSLCVCFVFIC